MGFKAPRPIQAKTLPAAIREHDVLGLAQTGTGKTAAFGIPIIEKILARRRPGPTALIVAPTRELAMQIHAELELLGRFTTLKMATIYGGVAMNKHIRTLKARPDILIACPGRLLDLYRSGHCNLSRIETLVLDEADHMLDMGFLPDIRRILTALPEDRQNLLFSATMPREIRKLADRVLVRPHVVELNHSQPAETIEHFMSAVDHHDKGALLRHILSQDDFSSAIVFLRTKYRARRTARDLGRKDFRAVALEGNMSQDQRDRAMKGFRSGRHNILVATDIAARGIDVADVSHVINYDLPNTPDAYTHRIGRTGRAEVAGKAITFVTPDDKDGVKGIEKKLGARIPWRNFDYERSSENNAPVPKPGGHRPGGPKRQRRKSDGPKPGGPGGSKPARRRQSQVSAPKSEGSGTKRPESKRPESRTASWGSGIHDGPPKRRTRAHRPKGAGPGRSRSRRK